MRIPGLLPTTRTKGAIELDRFQKAEPMLSKRSKLLDAIHLTIPAPGEENLGSSGG